MGTVTKSPLKSKTMWFGLASIVLGAIAAILAFLDAQGIVSAQTGVTTAVMGVITVILRYKTTVAVALGIDDPTTPEDESKGERPKTNSGFARLSTLLILAVSGLILLGTLNGCAHLTVREQQAITASVDCATKLFSTAQICIPDCLAKPTPAEQKECAVACTLTTAETVAPVCAQAYGDIHSPQLGLAVRSAVESAFMIYEAVKK